MMLFNQVMRYLPVLDDLRRKHPARILEVGSGSTGLGPYWKHPLIGCDIRFTDPLHPHLRGVCASATALPFGDAAFDCVCSLDLLEHLRPEERQSALSEMMRVAARWVVVGYPAGRGAQWADRAVQRFYDWRGGTAPDWLGEHLAHALPDGREVHRLARTHWRITRTGNENLLVHFLGIVLETRAWFYHHAGDMLQRHAWLIAPLSIAPYYRQFYFLERMD